MKQNIKTSFKLLNYRLLFIIFITFLVPAFLQTLRMYFVGRMANPESYSIAANLQWVNVIFEVLNEAFLLPLFFIFHKIIAHNKKIIGKTYFITFIYLFFIILFISIANPLLKAMAPSSYGWKTLDYVRVEINWAI